VSSLMFVFLGVHRMLSVGSGTVPPRMVALDIQRTCVIVTRSREWLSVRDVI